MLKRLLMLCGAERGAVLLKVGEHAGVEPGEATQAPLSHPAPSSTHLSPQAYRALALHDIHEEEVFVLLTTFPPADAHIHAPGLSCWITYRLSFGELVTESEQPLSALSESARSLETPHEAPRALAIPSQAGQPLQALLVMGWTGKHKGECAAAVRRCHTLLPLVANAAGAVIASILLAERVHELESTSVREALEGMELLKAELLGTVGHELRSPLASIKGYAGTLLRHERRLSREERHQFLLAINEASDRLEVIIERLLEVSQLETGQITIERSPVDVAHLASEAIVAIEERVTGQFPGRFTFNVRLEHADGTPSQTVPLILADPRRLREALDNLLENAIKYSPEGGIIEVRLRSVVHIAVPMQGAAPNDGEASDQPATQLPRQMLEICVCDTGIGIPAEHLERIFDRFHRVDTRLTREINGLGLGLTICKRIVELHDGFIWAENGPDQKGSTFYMRLPVNQVPLD